MKKRFFVLILAALLAMLMLMPVAGAEDDTPDPTAGYYYVYTENGKTLNVRDMPNGIKVGNLKYGTRIYCYFREPNGWALIDYTYDKPGYGKGTYACYVNSRFLVKNKPAPRTASTTTTTTTAKATASADTVADLNAEFKAAKKVEAYTVYTRPTRVSGWVNLRWAPSKSAEVITTYKNNMALLVIAELKNWYQVEDPETGNVGFMDKAFLTR